MKQVRGIVDRVIDKGKFVVLKIVGDDQGYFSWKNEIKEQVRKLREGYEVSFKVVEENTKYPKILSIDEWLHGSRGVLKSIRKLQKKEDKSTVKSEDRDDLILKQVALKAAVELQKAIIEKLTKDQVVKQDNVLAVQLIANHFYNWLKGDYIKEEEEEA